MTLSSRRPTTRAIPTCIAQLTVFGFLALSAACRPMLSRPDDLVIASTWSPEARKQLESQFRDWLIEHPERSGQGRAVRIRWIGLSSERDLERFASRFSDADVLMGTPIGSTAISKPSDVERSVGPFVVRLPRARGLATRSTSD